MNERKVFWFVLLMAAFVLVAFGVSPGGRGCCWLSAASDFTSRTTTNVARRTQQPYRDSSEVVDSIADRVSDISSALESIREDQRKEREAEKEKARQRFWRKVAATIDGGGPFTIN